MGTKIPFRKILEDTMEVSGGIGMADIRRLHEAVRYWAPEVRERWFWYGHCGVVGYLDILNNYFHDNDDVRCVYSNFMNEHYKIRKV